MIAVILIQGYYGNVTVVLKVREKLLIFCWTVKYKKQMDKFLRLKISGVPWRGRNIASRGRPHLSRESPVSNGLDSADAFNVAL